MTGREAVAFGKLGRPHGLNGELRFFPHNPDSQHAQRLQVVELRKDQRSLRSNVAELRHGSGALIIRLERVADRHAAELWANADVFVDPSVFDPLEPGEFYSWQLEGLTALDPQLRTIGTVRGFEDFGAGMILVVTIAGRDVLVPFAAPWVGDIDPEARTVVIDAADLLE